MSKLPGRRIIGGTVAVLAVMGMLAGCAQPTEAPGKSITFGIAGANLGAGHMDIHSTQLDVGALVLRNTFDSLVAQGLDGKFTPWLAKSWKISDDGLHYTFQLRDDVTFHDGEPFNAQAVKANFDHVVDPATASAQAASLIGYAEEGGYYINTEVVDEFTVKVNFSQPYAPFLQGVSLPQLGFYSPQVLAEHADELKAGGPGITVGTGPFVLSEYTPDQELVFTANPEYRWPAEGSKHQGVAASEKLVIRILPEDSSRVGAVSSGDVDVAADFTPSMADQVPSGVSTTSVELPGIPYSLYLNEADGVFADQKVRQAFRIGFDIQTAVDSIYFGQFDRAWSVLGPTTPNSYDDSLEGTWAFDQKKANALLDEAGWTARDGDGYRVKNGGRLSARWIAWTPVADDKASLADVIQSDLKAIGFEIVRDVLEPAQYNEAYGPRNFDLTDWSFSSPDADVLRSHLHSGGFQTVSEVTKPQVDAWLDEAVATSDIGVRQELYQRIQRWNNEQVLIVPLFVPSEITVANDNVKGLTYDLYGRPAFYGASTTVG